MDQIAFVTGADRGLGLALVKGLLGRGWKVFAGQYMTDWPELMEVSKSAGEQLHIVPLDVSSMEAVRKAEREVATLCDHLDLLINDAGVLSPSNPRPIREEQDYDEMLRVYDVNALGPVRVVEAFLPLLDQGQMKRLCFVSSEAGSIGRCQRAAWFGYNMSKAGLNMAVKILFNDLHPQGYTFRLYHPGWVRSYMSGKKNTQADLEPEQAASFALPIFLDPLPDEDRLYLVDYRGNEWPW